MNSFRPLNDRVLVEPLEEVYKGQIILPDNRQKERPSRGRVVSMGPGMLMKTGARWPMPDCKAGDIVIYSPTGSSDIEFEGRKLVAVRDSQIHAVLEE